MGKRALVLGGTGFVGRNLCKALKERGYSVESCGRDECDLRSGRHVYEGQGFDYVYHLAADTQAGTYNLDHGDQILINNSRINANAVRTWLYYGCKFITIGTSCAYDPNLPLSETNYMLGVPHESVYAYAMTKRLLYAMCTEVHRVNGLPFLYVIPGTLYGPGYDVDSGKRLHFIMDLIRKIHKAAKGGPVPTLWGDGFQKRELVYIDDFINTMVHLAECPTTPPDLIVNIRFKSQQTIRYFANEISDILGYDSTKIHYDRFKFVGVKEKSMEIKRLAGIGYAVPTSLRQGLVNTMKGQGLL